MLKYSIKMNKRECMYFKTAVISPSLECVIPRLAAALRTLGIVFPVYVMMSEVIMSCKNIFDLRKDYL